jgi:hypothetical protein
MESDDAGRRRPDEAEESSDEYGDESGINCALLD